MPKAARVISMVPSWTEMLLNLNIPVAGRTRFCIEPKNQITSIPIVGGTKDWNWDLIESLNPDLLVLDKEENPKFMSESSVPYVATHVTDINSCADGIRAIADCLKSAITQEANGALHDLSRRWDKLSNQGTATQALFPDLPGLIEWINFPTHPIEAVYYIIWKDPWLLASRNTFIGDMWSKLGLEISPEMGLNENKYPEIVLERLDKEKTLLLFSSEPYPFHKKRPEIEKLGFSSAIVDGQSFSWFGIRSLLFLETHFKLGR